MSVQIGSHQSIIDYCRSCPDDQLIGGSKYGNRVVKLPNYDLVVKFGRHVSSYEAKNQQEAYNTIDHNVVIVPWAHKFFVDDEGWGYMVSDFIPGKTIDPLPESHIRRLSNILEYLHSITSESTGSLCGGPSTGLLWPHTNDLFISIGFFPGDGEVHFDPSPSVLCHLDIAPRNLIWLEDGRVSLLDWASAGFYPRPLEFACLFFQEYHFGEALLSAMGFGSAREKEEQQKMCQALYNNERFSL
ncbi:hypothetical protein N7454_005436 [Penicillium verhagenii]|nr:hypothetical protein N7454_005436 [Penicillium verhagenii]